MEHLFSGTVSSIEPNPPDGSRFGIVDLNTVPNGGFPAGNLAYVRDEVVANLFYTGSLTGVSALCKLMVGVWPASMRILSTTPPLPNKPLPQTRLRS